MAIKIPDAPAIVGSDIELRAPQMVSPVSNTPQFKVDYSGLQESVNDVTKYYQGMVQDQTNTYLTDVKNEYLQHMRSYQDDIFQKHQGRNATDLYARFIKPESDKWLQDRYGTPKDDGEVRIVDKELQDQVTRWVSSQQPHFINSTASYEQGEWDAYRKTVFTARDNIAANMILNATTPETIQSAIDGFRQNTYTANPGMDKDFIEQAIASKVDASLVGHLNKVAMNEPYKAFIEMNSYEPIAKNLTDASKAQVMETIRKSYKNIGIDEYAHAEVGDKGTIGMVQGVEVLKQIFGNDWQEAQAEMKSKGKERAEALKKTQAGQHADVVNIAMKQVLNARNDAQLADGLRDLYAADPDAANAYITARDSWVANQQDIQNAGVGAEERIGKINENLQSIGQDNLREKVREELKTSGASFSDSVGPGLIRNIVSGFGEMIGVVPKGTTGENAVDRALKEKGKDEWKTQVKDSDINAVVDNLVAAEGEWERPRIEAAARMWKVSTQRQNQMPRYKELATKISSGEIRSYDPKLMGDLDYTMQQQLSVLIQNNNDFIDTKNDLKNAGIDLDKIIQDNGIDAQYKSLDVASQNLLKRNIVYEINNAKAHNQGMLPDADAINGIALRVQKNSVSPMMALLQDTALAQNTAAEDLTDAQRLELGVRESMSWDYNKPSKRGLDEQRKRAESAVNSISNSSRLTEAEQQYVKQNQSYLVSLYQAGDLAGMVNFIALATQGGF